MKKTIFLLVSIFFGSQLSSFAQSQFESNGQYGRMFDLTYDLTVANKMYAISTQNQILYSMDNGLNWGIFHSFPQVGSQISSLKTYGDHSLSFYMAHTGDDENNTVYILDLLTKTISKQYSPPTNSSADQLWIKAYSIDQANTDNIAIIQEYKIGLSSFVKAFYSFNGGSNWLQIYHNRDPWTEGIHLSDIALSPSDATKIFLARSGGAGLISGGMLVSTNSGGAWTESLVDANLNTISFHPNNPDSIYVGTGIFESPENLYRSIDGGLTWDTANINWDNYFLRAVNYTAFDPTDPSNIIVLEANEIVISNDDGATWTNYIYGGRPSDIYDYGLKASFNPRSTNEVAITGGFYPMNSIDGGATVSQLHNPFVEGKSVAISPDEKHLYYYVQYGVDHKDLTTGIYTPYEVLNLDIAGNFYTNFYVDENTNGRFFFAETTWEGAKITILDDHGATTTGPLTTPNFKNLYNLKVDVNNTDNVWLTWEDGSMEIIPISSPSSITNVSTPGSGTLFAILFDPSDPMHVIIGKGGLILESMNYGNSWTFISSGLGLDATADIIFDIQRNPNKPLELMAASTQGIHKSINSGANWTLVHSAWNVRRIEYSDHDNHIIAAAVYNGAGTHFQIHISDDVGNNWTAIDYHYTNYVTSSSVDFTFGDDSVYTYIATADMGVVKYSIDVSDMIVGAPELIGNQTISVFPNPANNEIRIEISDQQTIKNVKVYSVLGQLQIELNKATSIDISTLAIGTYFLKVENQSGETFFSTFVKE